MDQLGPTARTNLGSNVKVPRNLSPAELQALFPKLRLENFEIRSKAAARYNCMASANRDERHLWTPVIFGGAYYWPERVAREDTLQTWTEIFVNQGFELTNNRDVEAGFEKVAIYIDLTEMLPSHVAISDGNTWKSKLGKGQDIEHSSLDVLEGDEHNEYGIVERILKRPI